MKYEIVRTSKFKKDYKLSKRRGYNIDDLKEVVTLLANDKSLPVKNKDHPLSGNYKGYRECHIGSDWLLIYKISSNSVVLTLIRTGTHSDLFE